MLTETGWSYEELEARSGVSAYQIGRIVRGQSSPTLRTLESIATAFGLTLAELHAVGEAKILPEKETTHA